MKLFTSKLECIKVEVFLFESVSHTCDFLFSSFYVINYLSLAVPFLIEFLTFHWNHGLNSVTWKLSSERYSTWFWLVEVVFFLVFSPPFLSVFLYFYFFFFLARAKVVLWQLQWKQMVNKASWVLAGCWLSSKDMVLCPCSDGNSLCLSPNPLFSPCCWWLTLKFFRSSPSARWLTCLFPDLPGLILSYPSSSSSFLEGLRWDSEGSKAAL